LTKKKTQDLVDYFQKSDALREKIRLHRQVLPKDSKRKLVYNEELEDFELVIESSVKKSN
jgi:hypothetical protein